VYIHIYVYIGWWVVGWAGKHTDGWMDGEEGRLADAGRQKYRQAD
jgi:hypothetical protein